MTIEEVIEYLKFIYNKDYKVKNVEELKKVAVTVWKAKEEDERFYGKTFNFYK